MCRDVRTPMAIVGCAGTGGRHVQSCDEQGRSDTTVDRAMCRDGRTQPAIMRCVGTGERHGRSCDVQGRPDRMCVRAMCRDVRTPRAIVRCGRACGHDGLPASEQKSYNAFLDEGTTEEETLCEGRAANGGRSIVISDQIPSAHFEYKFPTVFS